QFGYQFGPFVFAAVLLSIGLVLQSNHREKHRHTAGRWPQNYEQWQKLRELWRPIPVCRRGPLALLFAGSAGKHLGPVRRGEGGRARPGAGPRGLT
ncbi:hypothetical protein VM98_37755, partial [Streptomyces rubellomurinus subsp. indigoferus]